MNIYTDGSILTNINSTKGGIDGGAGVYIEFTTGEQPVCLQQKIENSTNNISELTAILMALKFLDEREGNGQEVCIFSDSMYCLNSITKWYKKWKTNGWKTSSGGDVKNKELIHNITELSEKLGKNWNVRFEHVKGHAGNFGNEKADELAKGASKGC